MSKKPVYIHLGLMKTGTSYLQSIYWDNQQLLAEQGLALVPDTKHDMFHLMLDARDRYNPDADPPEVATAVERLPQQLDAAPGRAALITQESLSACRPKQIDRLLGVLADREVHVVITVRDIARQIPSSWQQSIQSGRGFGWQAFVESVVSGKGHGASMFWQSQSIPEVAARWEEYVPAERIHLVTVPPSGSAPTLLLERFSSLFGVAPEALVQSAAKSNSSLGLVQAEALRLVNGLLPADAKRRDLYGDVGKRWLGVQILGRERGERAALPRIHQDWCRQHAAEVIETLRQRGYHVVGDLADLEPAPDAFSDRAPEITDSQVLAVATQALADIVTERTREISAKRGQPAAPPPAAGPASVAQRLRRKVRQPARRVLHALPEPAQTQARRVVRRLRNR